jgi:hypothetical protein
MGAAVLLAAAWLLLRTGDAPDESGPPPAARVSPPAAVSTLAEPEVTPLGGEPSDSGLPASPAVAELAPETGADARLPPDLAEAVARYRAAESRDEREEILLELALIEDPESLGFLLEELVRAGPEERESVLLAIVQFGSRDAVPHLRELARTASSPDEARRLTEAADYLELPSLTEMRRELQER